MDFLKEILQKEVTKRVLILTGLGIILYLVRSILNLLLLTFIFTFLMYSIQNFLRKKLKRFVRIQQRILIIVLYLLMALGITFAIYNYVPSMIHQIDKFIKKLVEFYNDQTNKPQEDPFLKYLFEQAKGLDLSGIANDGVGFIFKQASAIKDIGLNIIFSVILSLFFLLERQRIMRFTSQFKTSRISFIYYEIEYFGRRFINSFGKVLEAQFLIALVNSVLSFLALWIMGFPQVFALSVMIFLLGLVPVAGVFISLIPLSMVAFYTGGVKMIIYVLIMITVLHALEAYFLNPKLMSAKTDLPIFYTFLILIVSEHFFSIWGLILGIPIFMFVLDLLDFKRIPKNVATDDVSDLEDLDDEK